MNAKPTETQVILKDYSNSRLTALAQALEKSGHDRELLEAVNKERVARFSETLRGLPCPSSLDGGAR